jgi:enterochelin esterase family protein
MTTTTRTLLLAATACVFCWTQAAEDSKPATSNIPSAQYPRIHPDLRITFRVTAPEAKRVQSQPGGGENGLGKGPFDMVRDDKGIWTATTPPSEPGFHYYWLIVDGFPCNDPSSETYFGWNKETSGIEVPDKVDFYEPKNVPHGDVRARWYFSKTTGQWRRAYVYSRRITTRISKRDTPCSISSTAQAKANVVGRRRAESISSSTT